MSAFQVTPKHLQAMLKFYFASSITEGRCTWRNHRGNLLDTEDMFESLAEANARSVGHRYQEDTEPVEMTDTMLTRTPALPPVAIIKACQSYDYQSCEHPAWDGSEAQILSQEIQRVATCALEGYEEADWAIS